MTNLNYDLVEILNNQPVTTSLKIAEVFSKNHKEVLRKVETLDCSGEFNQRNFTQVKRTLENGVSYKMFTITRDGFTFLAMGFTGKKAAQFKEAYINAFNQMEQTIKQQMEQTLKTQSLPKEESKKLLEDKNTFHYLSILFTRLGYIIKDGTVFFSLNDIDRFLEVTRLNGIDKKRTENNYTIHHILYDYNLCPYSETINKKEHIFLKLPQLIEFCYNFKTKRSEILLNYLETEITKIIPSKNRLKKDSLTNFLTTD
jgi:Rha family phage regulatory protein